MEQKINRRFEDHKKGGEGKSCIQSLSEFVFQERSFVFIFRKAVKYLFVGLQQSNFILLMRIPTLAAASPMIGHGAIVAK